MCSLKLFLVIIALCSLLQLSRQNDLLSTEMHSTSIPTTIDIGPTTTTSPPKIVHLGYQKTSEDLLYPGSNDSDEDYVYNLETNNTQMKLSISLNYFYCNELDKQPSLKITSVDTLTGIEFKTTWECGNITGDATIKGARSVTIKPDSGDSNHLLSQASISITAYLEETYECSGNFSFNCNGHPNQNIKEYHCIDYRLRCNGRRNCGEWDFDESSIHCHTTTPTSTTRLWTWTWPVSKRTTTEKFTDAWPPSSETDNLVIIFSIGIPCLVAVVFVCYYCKPQTKHNPVSTVGEPVSISTSSNDNHIGNRSTTDRQTAMVTMVPNLPANDGLPTYAEVMEKSKHP